MKQTTGQKVLSKADKDNSRHAALYKKYGNKLPTEAEMAASFGALKALHPDAKKLRKKAWQRAA